MGKLNTYDLNTAVDDAFQMLGIIPGAGSTFQTVRVSPAALIDFIQQHSAAADGREVEMQKSDTHVQWRYEGDVAWIDLIPLADITGPSGEQGPQGLPGAPAAWGDIAGTLSAQTDLQSALDGKVGTGDPRLTDAREWTAATVAQAEAEAGTADTRCAWTAQRVRQAIVAWWNGVTTAWSRGFVASADASAGRAALGLTLQASQNDSTAGRVMTVPAFGFGATTANNLSTPDDALGVANGLYSAQSSAFADAPYGSDAVYISHQRGSNSAVQMAQRAQTGAGAKIRMYSGGAWTAWAELWSSRTANAVTVDTGSFGYGVGSGGTITQATSKASNVTLNKPSGKITMSNESLAAGASVSFLVTTNKVGANDVVIPNIDATGPSGVNYRLELVHVAVGTFRLRLTNVSAGSLGEAVVINFVIIKGAGA